VPSREDVVFRNERTTTVPPFILGVHLEKGLGGDGMGRCFLAADDARQYVPGFAEGVLVQVAEAQFGYLRESMRITGRSRARFT
jgi:hypothetical protein